MKNYKLIAPVVLVVLFVLGIYQTTNNRLKDEKQYNQYLEEARAYAAQEIELYAGENYQNALNMRPTLKLYLEIAHFYQDTMGNHSRALEWGERTLTAYPKSPESYNFLLAAYLKDRDPMSFFELYDTMRNRHVVSAEADALYQSVEYEYYLQGEYDEVSVFSGGLAPVRRNETWGYSNSKGKKKIGTIYAYAGAFNNGMAPVIDADGSGFFIDSDGNKVFVVDTEETVSELGSMSSADIYAVNNGREWNYYDKSGRLVMGGFTEATALANGLAACRTQEGWRIYDVYGNIHIDEKFDDVLTDEKNMAYRNERLFIKKDSAVQMIDESGKRVGTQDYEDARIFFFFFYAAVKSGGKWGFIDKEGNWFIEPAYEDARSFSNGYAAVCLDGMWGFINLERELCIPCQFTAAKDFTANGTVFVQNGTIWSVLLLYQKNYG